MEKNITPGEERILDSPVFIVGSGRSGTTWLQRLLLEHPQITGGQESEFFMIFSPCLSAECHSENVSRKLGMSTYWDQSELDNVILDIWKQTFISMLRIKPQATILAEKTPLHALHMDVISKFLPNARFIHIIRDSRSVVASMNAAKKGWGKSWAPSSTKNAAISWWHAVRAARKSGKKLSNRNYIEVYYEELLASTCVELARIYDYVGVNYSTTLLEEIVNKQSIDNQRLLSGTGFKDRLGNELKEPNGFFRKGKADSWKIDLNFYQKIVVWRFTRKLMRQCGYNWRGRT